MIKLQKMCINVG